MEISSLNKTKIPEHVAIIMDGNGRWAESKNLPRISGHKKGVKAVKNIVEVASSIGIKTLTLFTFSYENWQRPHKEVSSLMKLLISSLRKELNDLIKNNIRFHFIGDLEKVDSIIVNELISAKDKTSSNSGMMLNLALSYGSRQEIINAMKLIYVYYNENGYDINNITEEDVSANLYTSDISDPDLLIRTGGDYRLSNFLLWQIAYTELIISKKYWPDFSKSDFISSIKEFQLRERRFGRLSN